MHIAGKFAVLKTLWRIQRQTILSRDAGLNRGKSGLYSVICGYDFRLPLPCVSIWYKRRFNEARCATLCDPNVSRIIVDDYSQHWHITSFQVNYATYIFYTRSIYLDTNLWPVYISYPRTWLKNIKLYISATNFHKFLQWSGIYCFSQFQYEYLYIFFRFTTRNL